ncbi:MAG TPA: hypothetical protein VJ981_00970, partial [Gammaproteobacteria bacterium]|nr:hypothetical protein [Gammaproteobacteria bacterium]
MQASGQNKRRREESIPWIPALIIVLVIIAGVYFWLYGEETVDIPETLAPVENTLPDELKVPEQEPAIKYPVTAPEPVQGEGEPEAETANKEIQNGPRAEQQPEPGVEATTSEPEPVKIPSLNETLADFLGPAFGELFIPDSLVRNFVVTVDNMTSEKLPQR